MDRRSWRPPSDLLHWPPPSSSRFHLRRCQGSASSCWSSSASRMRSTSPFRPIFSRQERHQQPQSAPFARRALGLGALHWRERTDLFILETRRLLGSVAGPPDNPAWLSVLLLVVLVGVVISKAPFAGLAEKLFILDRNVWALALGILAFRAPDSVLPLAASSAIRPLSRPTLLDEGRR